MTDRDFDAFWAAERDVLVRVLAVALGDAEAAAESVDEAMARAWSRWSRVGSLDNPAAWVLRVARNHATSRWRWRSRRPTVPVEALDRAVADGDPDVDLDRALAELTADQRLTVVLRFHLDWTVAQIADVTGVREGTVKSRLHRALGVLREHLDDDTMTEATP